MKKIEAIIRKSKFEDVKINFTSLELIFLATGMLLE